MTAGNNARSDLLPAYGRVLMVAALALAPLLTSLASRRKQGAIEGVDYLYIGLHD